MGVGIARPLGKLHVAGAGNVIFDTSGSMGIGTTAPREKTGPGVTDGAHAYLDVKDVWLRDVSKWASELGGGLPDTGQTNSYAATFNDDADYLPTATQPNYTSRSIAGDAVTVDNITGLMWVQDGTSKGANNDVVVSWEVAGKYCQDLGFAGYSDWRLPNIRELMSIVYYGTSSEPRINTAYFFNIRNGWYWTSTTYANGANADYTYCVNFVAGNPGTCFKTTTYSVLCVRGGL